MSNSNEEVYVIKLKDVNFMAGMKAAQDAADTTKNKVSGIGGAMGNLKGIIAGIGVAKVGNDIVQTLAKFEKFEAVLTSTLGSGSAADDAMKMITDFAASTPYEVDELTDSFVRLANQGFVPTKDEMISLGDLAASKGKEITQLSEALIDAQVGEFERLKEFGVRAKKNGDQVSFTFKGVTKTVKMTDEAIKDYIVGLGNVKGVSGQMAAISATTGGQISNLGDTVTALYLNLGTKLKPVISLVIQGLSGAVDAISSFANWLVSGSTGARVFQGVVMLVVGALVTYQAIMGIIAAKTAIVTAAQWLWNAAMTANPIGIIIVAIGALIAFIGWLVASTEGWGEAWKHTWNGIKLIFSGVMGLLKTDWLLVQDIFLTGIDLIMIAWYKLKSLWNEDEANAGMASIQKESDARKKALKEAATQTVDDFKNGLDEFKKAGQSIKWKKDDPKKKEDGAGMDKVKPGGSGTGGKQKGLGAGLSEVRSSAPKNFYITIGNLVKDLNINTTNIKEGALQLKEEVTKLLLTAVNDMQIISSN